MKLYKPSLLFLLFILSFSSLHAQNIYAPAGAEWYNQMPYGAYHSYVKGDTVINGTSCRILSQEAMYLPASAAGGYMVDPPKSTFYVYDTQDTVFIYNTLFHRFTPVFVFNVNAGDTVRLPLTQLQGCRTLGATPDSLFSIVIDSVSMVHYGNSIPLKTVYSRSVQTAYPYQKWSYGNTNVYAERLGSLSSNILPNCYNCGQCLSEAHTITPGSLLCYHDAQYELSLTSGPCDNGATAIAPVSNAGPRLDLYPNPAGGKVYINNKTGCKIEKIWLQSATGMRSAITVPHAGYISTEYLPDGFYFFRFQLSNGCYVIKPVTVVH